MSSRRYWLMKSEPSVYSIEKLAVDGETGWEGVRNYQARNLMRDEMKLGDLVLFYHSNASPPGVAGLAQISGEAHPDPHALNPASRYYDPEATPENPRWVSVKLAFVERWPQVVSLETLKADPALAGMMVTRRGARLSVQPVSPEHFERVVALGRAAYQ